MSARKLTQQWLVDLYLQTEANLNNIPQNQQRLHAQQYQEFADHVAYMAENENIAAGVDTITNVAAMQCQFFQSEALRIYSLLSL